MINISNSKVMSEIIVLLLQRNSVIALYYVILSLHLGINRELHHITCIFILCLCVTYLSRFDTTETEHKNDDINAYSVDADREGTELKHFLLTSPSFIGHAKKLFNLDVDHHNTLEKDETIYRKTNMRLYLDCAYELTERKSLQDSEVVRSLLLACGGNSRLRISLCKLVEEICNGIENLKFYREDYDCREEDFAYNDTFAMMEKDMKCKGEINGMWESGWRTGFCADEAQLVVNKIESLLISGLIEDLVINLLA